MSKASFDNLSYGNPPKLVAAANKAFTELGWKPKYPKLDDLVATAWA